MAAGRRGLNSGAITVSASPVAALMGDRRAPPCCALMDGRAHTA
jgi:hypothetical protein